MWTVVKILACLVVTLGGMVWVLRWLARRGFGGGDSGLIEVVAVRPLAPGKSIQVVRVGGRRLLLGVADQITVLADLGDFAEAAELESIVDRVPAQPRKGDFADALHAALQRARAVYGAAPRDSQTVPIRSEEAAPE